MEYDPLKNKLDTAISLFPALRRALFGLMDILLLRQRYIKREIQKRFKQRDALRFYDAGAGFCQYSCFVLSNWKHATVHASDLKSNYLASFANYAASIAPKRFSYIAADLQDYVPKGSFDLTIAIDILEHIENDIAVLANFHKALAANGTLIISTPSDTDPAAKFTAEHVRPGYAKEELERKLINAGFVIDKSIYTYGFWGRISWKLMMKYPMQLAARKLYPLLIPYYLVVYPISEILMQLDIRSKNISGTGIMVVAHKP
jgi:SAM-dependent methyltransferase